MAVASLHLYSTICLIIMVPVADLPEARAPWHPLCYFSTFEVLWFHFFWGWSSFPCEVFPLYIYMEMSQ